MIIRPLKKAERDLASAEADRRYDHLHLVAYGVERASYRVGFVDGMTVNVAQLKADERERKRAEKDNAK